MARAITAQSDERAFAERLKRIEAVVHNQDNREHDLLDSDDYYQFEGGMTRGRRSGVGQAAARLSQRPFASRAAGHPHARGRSRPRHALARRQSEMDRWRQAPWLQGRLRDRGDRRLHVRLRRDDGCGAKSIISISLMMPSSRMRRRATSSPHNNPAALVEKSPSGSKKRSRAACGRRAPTRPMPAKLRLLKEGHTRMSEDEDARHHEKMQKKKAARDKIMAARRSRRACSSSIPARARASRPPPSAWCSAPSATA